MFDNDFLAPKFNFLQCREKLFCFVIKYCNKSVYNFASIHSSDWLLDKFNFKNSLFLFVVNGEKTPFMCLGETHLTARAVRRQQLSQEIISDTKIRTYRKGQNKDLTHSTGNSCYLKTVQLSYNQSMVQTWRLLKLQKEKKGSQPASKEKVLLQSIRKLQGDLIYFIFSLTSPSPTFFSLMHCCHEFCFFYQVMSMYLYAYILHMSYHPSVYINYYRTSTALQF